MIRLFRLESRVAIYINQVGHGCGLAYEREL